MYSLKFRSGWENPEGRGGRPAPPTPIARSANGVTSLCYRNVAAAAHTSRQPRITVYSLYTIQYISAISSLQQVCKQRSNIPAKQAATRRQFRSQPYMCMLVLFRAEHARNAQSRRCNPTRVSSLSFLLETFYDIAAFSDETRSLL